MSEEILSAALVAQLITERDDWRGRAERAEAEIRDAIPALADAPTLSGAVAMVRCAQQDLIAAQRERECELLAEVADLLAELSSYRASLLVLQQALAAERRRIALRFAADPRWRGDYADAMGLMLEEDNSKTRPPASL